MMLNAKNPLLVLITILISFCAAQAQHHDHHKMHRAAGDSTMKMGHGKHHQDGMMRRGPEEKAAMRTQRMITNLGLDSTQAKRIRAINQAHAEKLKTLRERVKTKHMQEHEKIMQQADSLDHVTEQAYKQVLTPEQFKKHQAAKAKQKEKAPMRNKGSMKMGKQQDSKPAK